MVIFNRYFQAAIFKTVMVTATLGAGLPALGQDIGTMALAVAPVTGTPPQVAPRALAVGMGVVQDETLRTGAGARAEVLFADQTSLAMGENTAVVLDRFVYDPATGGGEMALSLTRGVLRFIGGALSDSQPALIKTPTATIGVRGSSAIATTNGRQTQVVFVAGNQLCLTPNGASSPICTNVIGGVLTDQGFIGQIDAQSLQSLLAAIDRVAAGGGSISDLDGLDLAQLVPLDVVPYSTGGGQSDTGAENPLDALPGDGVSYTTEITIIETIFDPNDPPTCNPPVPGC